MLRIAKRSEISKKTSISIRAAAIILAFLAGAIFISILDFNPLSVYASMIKGAFGSSYSIKETIVKAIPLVITSLGIGVAFKMQFWNIGGEGQIAMGALSASFFALKFPNMNRPLLLVIMIAAGIIGGGLWALIPAFLKSKWKTNETIITLMMNYIALKIISFLQNGPWKDPNAKGFHKIANFTDNAILPDLFGINIGWIIAIILVIVMYIFMNYSKKGYEISVLGESEKTAQYAGININKTIIIAMLISGGLCGLTGMIQASAVSNTLSDQVTGGVGFTAIIITWLSSLSAPIILVVSILFAGLVEGGSYIQTAFGIPEAAAQMLQGMILFFVLGSEFFINYKVIFKNKVEKETTLLNDKIDNVEREKESGV